MRAVLALAASSMSQDAMEVVVTSPETGARPVLFCLAGRPSFSDGLGFLRSWTV